jgi:uncharacterized protein with HEPN domain
MRDELQRLGDILEATKLLTLFQAGRNREDLKKDLLLRSALLHQLFVIGEEASRLSQPLKDKHSAVPWRAICGFRNFIAPEYFSLDSDIIWQTVVFDVPSLEAQIAEILGNEALRSWLRNRLSAAAVPFALPTPRALQRRRLRPCPCGQFPDCANQFQFAIATAPPAH